MSEYGIFTDEGCIEAQFTTAGEAEERAEEYRADGEECTVQEMCLDHRDDEQPKNGCEDCAAEVEPVDDEDD
ncbi:hypothetical protein ACW7N6_38345 [Streptomyces sp. UC1A3]